MRILVGTQNLVIMLIEKYITNLDIALRGEIVSTQLMK